MSLSPSLLLVFTPRTNLSLSAPLLPLCNVNPYCSAGPRPTCLSSSVSFLVDRLAPLLLRKLAHSTVFPPAGQPTLLLGLPSPSRLVIPRETFSIHPPLLFKLAVMIAASAITLFHPRHLALALQLPPAPLVPLQPPWLQ